MRKVLSIVVPAYNVERYIKKCLDSFVMVEHRNLLEVIVVNDGSTDQTGEIISAYCEQYPDLIKSITKENGGHGSAINAGMGLVSGTYFHVVDSDDWVDSEEMDRFLVFLSDIDVDLVANNFCIVQDETYKVLEYRNCIDDEKKAKKKLTFDSVASEIPLIRIHAMTVNTDFYRRHEIQIDSYRYYVDFEYTLFPIPYVETVAFYNHYVCQYRVGRNGQSVNIGSMQRNRENHMLVIHRLLEWYQLANTWSYEKKKYIEMGISKIVENQFQIYISMGLQKGILKEMALFDEQLKENAIGVYNAVSKKSIWILRKTKYKILPLAYVVYRIVKG